jgi:hypothetical protein
MSLRVGKLFNEDRNSRDLKSCVLMGTQLATSEKSKLLYFDPGLTEKTEPFNMQVNISRVPHLHFQLNPGSDLLFES